MKKTTLLLEVYALELQMCASQRNFKRLKVPPTAPSTLLLLPLHHAGCRPACNAFRVWLQGTASFASLIASVVRPRPLCPRSQLLNATHCNTAQ